MLDTSSSNSFLDFISITFGVVGMGQHPVVEIEERRLQRNSIGQEKILNSFGHWQENSV